MACTPLTRQCYSIQSRSLLEFKLKLADRLRTTTRKNAALVQRNFYH